MLGPLLALHLVKLHACWSLIHRRVLNLFRMSSGEPFLEEELDSKVFEISTQSFFSAFLPSPPSLSDEGAAAVECLSALTRDPEKAEHSAPTQDGSHDDKARMMCNNNPLVQISRYARCVKLEQFDRKFIFTLTFTQHTCRVARWDLRSAT